jgi:hypothetical protein
MSSCVIVGSSDFKVSVASSTVLTYKSGKERKGAVPDASHS